jgi:hypothetical protein
VAPSSGPPYEGIFQAPSPTDSGTGNPLPENVVYVSNLGAGQTVMLYTVAGAGAGTEGDSAFTAIDPTQFKGVTLSVEAGDNGSTAVNYFAVQVGGQWYVSANPLTASNPGYPQYTLTSTPYTTTASAWNQLAISANSVTIGSAATANLSGPITGVGLIQVGPGGWNYNEVTITATPSPIVYTEDWGSSNGNSASLGNIGWTLVAPSSGPPYEGIFQAPSPTDSGTGSPLPQNVVYFSNMGAGQTAMLYTISGSGAGTDGDSAFNAIDPTEHTGLTLSVEAGDNGSTAVNYFAVQVGGQWYISATPLTGSNPGYPQYTLTSTPYTTAASAWDQLAVNANSVTIGSVASANLSGLITGIGLVQVGPGGWNYNELIVSASVPSTVTAPSSTIYSEDWGTPFFDSTGTQNGATDVTNVGWSSSGIAYVGSYAAPGSLDPGTGVTFPPPPLGNINGTNNVLYASLDQASDIGIFYTTDTNGPGADGDATFTDINLANYPGGVVLNLDSQTNSTTVVTDYFAVQIGAVAGVGGQWYVSTNALTNNGPNGTSIFAHNSLVFNSASNNWNLLTFQEGPLNATGSVTIGGPATVDLSGSITGVGIVVVGDSAYTGGTSGYGINYANFSITTPLVNSGDVKPKIDAAGFSQTAYAGGTASFAVDAFVGTAPLTYTWTLQAAAGGTSTVNNGPTGTGSFITGATSSLLTISNAGSADAGTYSMEVGNLYGSDDSTNYATNTLTVNPLPNDILYAETFPFVGPFPAGASPAQDGWFATVPTSDNPNRLDESGSLYSYENTAMTTGFFTSSATDVPGLSGLPFTNINPANFSFVSFRAGIANPNSNNASIYFAVEMTGGQWYVSSSALQLAANRGVYNTYGLQFSTAMQEWNTLTVSTSSAAIGSPASANLSGDIIGAGLVFVFTGAIAEYDVNYFAVVTDSTPPVLPSFPSEPDVPYPQSVYTGGGASFFFTEAGTLPLTNNWQFNDNGVNLSNGVTATGSIVSGAQTTEITIQNAGPADQGSYDPTVSNPAGTANVDSSEYGPPTLTVVAPPIGLIYNESFPLYQPITANQPMGIIGWTNQSDTPARIYQIGTALEGLGAAYAYEGVQTNSLFYASTTTDTGFSGLPFVAFDPATYPAGTIGFSVAMEAGNAEYTNASASFAVEQGGQWYVMATPVQPTNDPDLNTTGFTTLGPEIYSPAASQWRTVTLTGTAGVSVGGVPSQNLTGPITASGLLFQHYGTAGASLDFDSFTIQATGVGSLIGGIEIGPLVNGTATLTWVGNPAVFVQSSTDLVHWAAMPNTQGNHMLTVSGAASHLYYRLAGPLP